MKKIMMISLIIIIGFSIIILPAKTINADQNKKSSLDLKISPKDSLFNIDNMKPGDWAPRTLLVENNGQQDFDYTMVIENIGSDRLFNELLLEIAGEEGPIFEGNLAAFTELPTRQLTTAENEELDITIRFPEQLGNEFQGLDTQFKFIFTAEGNKMSKDSETIGSEIGSDDGSILPNTATGIFNFLLIGILLVAIGGVFLLYKKKVKKLSKQIT